MLTALDLPLEVWEEIVNQPALDMPSVRRFSTVSSACRAIAHQRRLTVTPGCGIFTDGDEGDEAAAERQSEALETMHEDGAWPLVRVAPEVLCRVALALYKCGLPRHVEAVRWWRQAAEQGYANAQFDLGVCYAHARGVEGDTAEALRWWRLAAEQGNANAQHNLGYCYANGEGVEEDKVEAARWWRRAAEQGNANAQFNLGCCCTNADGAEEDEAEAVRWWRRAAEQGNADAQCNLGYCYGHGEGVEEDKVEAARWYQRAAEQRNADAQYNLGLCYNSGEGLEEDKAEAERWFERAAEQGDPDAQCCLGRLRFTGGDGVAKDAVRAGGWLHKAAGHGHGPGSNWLGLWLLATGDGDPSEARRLFRAAIDADAPDDEDEFVGYEARARRNLGLALEGGVGGDVDLAGALTLYREAATGEHPDAVVCYSLWLLASEGAEGTTAADAEPFQALRVLEEEERAALARAAIEEHELLSGSELPRCGHPGHWERRGCWGTRGDLGSVLPLL